MSVFSLPACCVGSARGQEGRGKTEGREVPRASPAGGSPTCASRRFHEPCAPAGHSHVSMHAEIALPDMSCFLLSHATRPWRTWWAVKSSAFVAALRPPLMDAATCPPAGHSRAQDPNQLVLAAPPPERTLPLRHLSGYTNCSCSHCRPHAAGTDATLAHPQGIQCLVLRPQQFSLLGRPYTAYPWGPGGPRGAVEGKHCPPPVAPAHHIFTHLSLRATHAAHDAPSGCPACAGACCARL